MMIVEVSEAVRWVLVGDGGAVLSVEDCGRRVLWVVKEWNRHQWQLNDFANPDWTAD